MGVDFVLSVVRNWLMFLFMNNIESPQATQWLQMMQVLDFASVAVSGIWVVMAVIFAYQAIKRPSIVRKSGDGGVGKDLNRT